MITLRPSYERGHTTLSWLESAHTFSFNNYVDPRHMGFRQLRVINDDRVKPGAGFGTHSHRDMEIITYVLEGALEHRDSTGNGSVIRPGDVQRMSAGTGISHSEYNHSPTAPVHFLQIWILPERQGLDPSYEQRSFAPEELRGQWRLMAARDGRDGAVVVHQDVDVLAVQLEPGAAGRLSSEGRSSRLGAAGQGRSDIEWRIAQRGRWSSGERDRRARHRGHR